MCNSRCHSSSCRPSSCARNGERIMVNASSCNNGTQRNRCSCMNTYRPQSGSCGCHQGDGCGCGNPCRPRPPKPCPPRPPRPCPPRPCPPRPCPPKPCPPRPCPPRPSCEDRCAQQYRQCVRNCQNQGQRFERMPESYGEDDVFERFDEYNDGNAYDAYDDFNDYED